VWPRVALRELAAPFLRLLGTTIPQPESEGLILELLGPITQAQLLQKGTKSGGFRAGNWLP